MTFWKPTSLCESLVSNLSAQLICNWIKYTLVEVFQCGKLKIEFRRQKECFKIHNNARSLSTPLSLAKEQWSLIGAKSTVAAFEGNVKRGLCCIIYNWTRQKLTKDQGAAMSLYVLFVPFCQSIIFISKSSFAKFCKTSTFPRKVQICLHFKLCNSCKKGE